MNLISDAELAERFGITVAKLHELRKRHHWPHVKLGRFEVRFTEDQVEQIVDRHAVTPAAPVPFAEAVAGTSLAGQTKRSASRRRSA